MELRKGYKNSILGPIPNDWTEGTFEDYMSGFSSGQTPYRGRPEFYKGEIPWITSGELNYNTINDTLEKITEEGVKAANLKIIPKGTFLFAITGLEAAGTRGSCGITGMDATTNQSCMALYPKPNQTITPYIFQFYVKYGDWLAFNYCQGTKQQSYTGGIAKKLPFVAPSDIKEQTAIANALSDADAYISSLEKLIAKKRLIKQGAMQQLLKPKKGWVTKKLGDFLDYEQPTNYLVNDTEYNEFNQTPVLTAGKTFILGYTNEEQGIYGKLPVIIFDDFTTAVKYVDFPFKAKSSAMKMLIPKHEKVNLRFVYELMLQIKYIPGDHKRHWIGEYRQMEVIVPSNEDEQNEIANILENMDNEISSLETKLIKARQIKQGMMQELLTGKIRLV
ncbi:MAG: restriction endonuclease subunit S [Sediminibacterium sp.]|nr:restriction endonuclease subunit S [Sediminibacterium sp.]